MRNKRLIVGTLIFLLSLTGYGFSCMVRVPVDSEERSNRMQDAAIASGHSLTRRDFFKAVAALPFVSKLFLEGQDANLMPSAEIIGQGTGFWLRSAMIVEPQGQKTVQLITDPENPNNNKMLQWRWANPGQSWTFSEWQDARKTMDLSGYPLGGLIFRFVFSGLKEAVFKVIFEDDAARSIEFNSNDFLVTADGKQYFSIRLEEAALKNPDFNWGAVKPVRFTAVSPGQGVLIIKDIEILDVRKTREYGIGIGMYLDREGINGNNFPPLANYTGEPEEVRRQPVAVLSYSIFTRDPDELLTLWRGLREDQMPHEVVEFWPPVPAGASAKMYEEARRMAEEMKIEIMQGMKPEDFLKHKAGKDYFQRNAEGMTMLQRIGAGEFDNILIRRAQKAAEYGRPVLLRMLHEPTGGWYPWACKNKQEADDYIKAWKRIVKIYRDNSASNVIFVFSPHNFEPDTLQQTRKYQMIDYILWHIQQDVEVIGIDAFSYPPSGGYLNVLVTGLSDLVKKYRKPLIIGETSSGMSDADKRIFWDTLEKEAKSGVFSNPLLVMLTIFSTKKEENDMQIDFVPPSETMRRWEQDEFFATNPFQGFRLPGAGDIEGIEPGFPLEASNVAAWIVNSGNIQFFTSFPDGKEEWFWYRLNNDYVGHGIGIIVQSGLNNSTIRDYEFTMPLEIFEGNFNLVFEDNSSQPVGNQIIINSNDLFKYLSDGRLTIPLSEVAKFEKDGRKFNWGNIRQLKLEPTGQIGRAIIGKPLIRRIGVQLGSSRHEL